MRLAVVFTALMLVIAVSAVAVYLNVEVGQLQLQVRHQQADLASLKSDDTSAHSQAAALDAQLKKLETVPPATCVLWTANGRYNVSIYESGANPGSWCDLARKANWRATGPAVGGIVCDMTDKGDHFVFRTPAATSYFPCEIAGGFFAAFQGLS